MARIPRLDTEEGHRLYRIYVIERIKQIAGYSLMGGGLAGLFAVRALGTSPKLTLACLVAICLGGIIHYSRTATKQAAKIRIEPKKRFPPPPIESNVAGARPSEVSKGEY
ncbi:MAG: hypothetical protein ABL949_14835, partial [Fimbriimonadaceae bacterium]